MRLEINSSVFSNIILTILKVETFRKRKKDHNKMFWSRKHTTHEQNIEDYLSHAFIPLGEKSLVCMIYYNKIIFVLDGIDI